MIIQRELYLDKLIRRKHNGMIKVITGLRRSGKSYLLFNLFYEHLLKSGISQDHIIKLSLDDIKYKKYRNPDNLYKFVTSLITDNSMYYVLLDEVQFVKEFEEVLNGFLNIQNVDTYVTGSNAKFLSKDIITEFRGRGDQVHIFPLSFKEFYSVFDGDKLDAYNEFINFGGLPKIIEYKTSQDKSDYLKNIFVETYIKDIKERNDIRTNGQVDALIDVLASSIGSFTNPTNLANTFKSFNKDNISSETIKRYLDFFEDSFLVEKAKKYDIKGKKYISVLSKYFFTDIGLRNARLNFRQIEETHILENIVYNELRILGYNVDVGQVNYYEPKNGKSVLSNSEVDFVCNQSDKRYYIQVSLSLPNQAKTDQEQKSLIHISDSFKKILIVKDLSRTHYNEQGILMLSLFDFLLNNNSLEQ